jgi:hypothetical protein
MQPSLALSRIVKVDVLLSPAGAQAQSLSNMLILGTSNVIDSSERYRSYNLLADVASDFGTTAMEYLAASKWFSQVPQPTELLIGRWVNANSRGGLRGATLSASAQAIASWNAITTGSFKIAKNGAAGVDVTGLNFSGAANLNAVAGIIAAAAGMTGTTTVVWNATYARFEIESTTAGVTSAIGFLVPAATGTDISAKLGMTAASSGAYVYTGQVAETALAAVALMDNLLGQQWYGLAIPAGTNDDHLAVAAYIEGSGTKHTYWVTSAEAGALVDNSSTDLGYLLSQLNVRRTYWQFSSSNPYAAISAAARILTTDYSGANTVITLKFKNEPGIIAEYLNASQANALEGKNGNVFVHYNNDTSILEQGVMADGTYTDVVCATDALAIEIQTALFNVLYTSVTKIPQTDAGQQILLATCEAVCSAYVTNGALAPGVWQSNGFGLLKTGDFMEKGFYVYSQSFSVQSQANRGARKAMPIQIAAKLAGAVHSVDVAVTVNQ